MSFGARTETAEALVSLLESSYWSDERLVQRLIYHDRLGYEVRLGRDMIDALQSVTSPTSHLVRFFPDAVVARRAQQAILFEYKVTRTPRYSLGEEQWHHGQIEAAAWSVYEVLERAGVAVAIVIYCPYHPRPLLCGRPERGWLTRAMTRVQASAGSGTPYVNIDLRAIPTFEAFMATQFAVPGCCH